MTKIKYFYNEETCSYEPVETSFSTKLLRITLYLIAALVVGGSSLFGYYKYNPTPKEELFVSDREVLDIQWDILQQEVNLINQAITDLHLNDHELREILELSDLPEEIREAGIGGDNQIASLKNQNLKFEEQIIETYQKIAKCN